VNHDELRDLAAVYALGALDGDDLVEFGKHASSCAECGREVREHERVAAEIGFSLAPVQPSPAVLERVMAAVRRPGRVIEAPFAWTRVVAAAAVVVVAVLGILLARANRTIEDIAGANKGLHEKIAARDDEAKRIGGQLDESKKKVETLQSTIRDLSADFDRNKEKIAALEKEKTERQKDLDRLAKMDALIRDIKSQVALLKGNDKAKDATGRVVWKDKEIVFLTTLPPAAEGKMYELWALVGGTPVPAGCYDAKGNVVKDYWKVPENAKITGWAVSLESGAVDKPTEVVMGPAN